MSLNSVVVLLVAPGPVSRAVSDILRDWSSAGLLREYVWLREDEVDPAAPELAPAADVMEGAAQRDRLQNLLSDRRFDEITLAVVSSATGRPPAGRLASAGTAAAVRNELTLGATHPTVALHCILARHGAGGWDDRALWDQWHNAVLAPEDAVEPGARPARLTSQGADERDAHQFHLHAAAAVASVTGLWKGMDAGPFRGLSYPNGPAAVVVRSFVRHLDAGAVTGRLRAEFADLSGGLPRPQVGGVRLEYVDATTEQEAVAKTAREVVARHPEIFVPEREELPGRVRVGGWTMLTLFLQFLWASIRNAPSAWLQALEQRYSTSAARMIQNLTGENSSYKIIVRGVDAKGLNDRVEQLAAATEALAQHLARLAPVDAVVPPLAAFWRDVHGGALTLADGESHVPQLRPPLVGGRPAVFRDPDRIVVRNEEDFQVSDPLSLATVPLVPAHDVRTGELLDRTLTGLSAGRTHESRDAGTELERLKRWRARLDGSFLGRIGQAVDGALRARIEDLLTLLAQLDEAAGQEQVDGDARAVTDSLGRRLRRALLALVVAVVVIVLAARPGPLATRPAILLLVLAFALWAAYSMSTFLRSALRRFAELCAEQPPDLVAVLGRNISRAAQEAHLLSIAYLQYQEWAPILSRFVHEPLGAGEAVSDPPLLGAPLPRALGLGRARPNPEAGLRLVDDVRDDVLAPGWMGRLWAQVLECAPAQLGREGRTLHPDDFLRDRMSDDSPLRSWSVHVREAGLPTAPSDAVWTQAREELFGRSVATLVGELFSRIEIAGRPDGGERLSGEGFLTGMLTALGQPRGFDHELFTSTGRTGAGVAVTSTFVVADRALCTLAGLRSEPPAVRLTPPVALRVGSLDQFVAVVETSGLLPGRDNLRLTGANGDAGPSDPGGGRPGGRGPGNGTGPDPIGFGVQERL